jgi:hypothetical protein
VSIHSKYHQIITRNFFSTLTIYFQNLKVTNATLLAPSVHQTSWFPVPNGLYKVQFKIFDDEDENILSVDFWQEKYDHNLDAEF